jgi:hypothetical protein
MLTNYLKNFGEVHHIHSRKPPEYLEGVSGEYFNGKRISPENVTVFFIYRNPIKAIYSRFGSENHLRTLKIRTVEYSYRINKETVLKTKKDLFRI